MRRLLAVLLAVLSLGPGAAFAGGSRQGACGPDVAERVARAVPPGAAAVVETPSGSCLVAGSRVVELPAERDPLVDAIICPILTLNFPPDGDVDVVYYVIYDPRTDTFYIVRVVSWDCPPHDH